MSQPCFIINYHWSVMTLTPGSDQLAMPLIRGIYCLLSAERARELTALLAKGACH